MKTPSPDLYQLIHSLGPSEKRYFSLFAKTLGRKKGSKDYAELFLQLSHQPVFDENKIRKNGLGGKNFKRLKQYTTSTLLRSLENFYAESTVEIQLNRSLVQAEILFHKKQFSYLKKCLDKALLLARERDLIQYLVPIIQLYYKSAISMKGTDEALANFSPEDLKRLGHDSWRWMELRRLDTRFWNLIHNRDFAGPEEIRLFREIAGQAYSVLLNGKSSYSVTREACNVMGLCYRFSGDTQKSYKWRKKLIETVESAPAFLHERNAEYIVAIGNLMNLCIEMKRAQDVEALFRKANAYMETIPHQARQADVYERFCNLKNSYISYLYKNDKYAEVIQYGQELHSMLRKHSGTLMNSLMPILLRTLVFSACYLKDKAVANRYYTLWTRNAESETEEMGIKLFGLILYYEQGERDLLYYRCRSFRYYLKKRQKKNLFAEELQKFISTKLIKAVSKAEEKAAFREFAETRLSKKKILADLPTAGYFDYLKWIKSKY